MLVAAIGGTMGVQWLIKDKFAINWNIVGLGGSINRVSAGFTSSDQDVFEVWRQDVEDFLVDVPGGSSFSVEADNANRTIDATGSFPFVNVRVSLSVGYRF